MNCRDCRRGFVLHADRKIHTCGSESRKLDTGEKSVLVRLKNVVFDTCVLRQLEEATGRAARVHVGNQALKQGCVGAGRGFDRNRTPRNAGWAAEKESRRKSCGGGGCGGAGGAFPGELAGEAASA